MFLAPSAMQLHALTIYQIRHYALCLVVAAHISIDHRQLDPLKNNFCFKSQCVDNILAKVKLRQSITNHMELFTFKMVMYMHNNSQVNIPTV